MKSITLLSAVLLAGAAHAAEVTLYKQPYFGGSQLTLRGHTPNLANTGFYDQASSIVVHSGRWEFCSQPDFRGDCVILNRGEYATLDPRLNHRIESAREVGSYAGNIGSYGGFVRGSIELYGQPGFGGRTLTLDRDTPTLENTGFDDRASSIVVREGTWQLCADPGYSGSVGYLAGCGVDRAPSQRTVAPGARFDGRGGVGRGDADPDGPHLAIKDARVAPPRCLRSRRNRVRGERRDPPSWDVADRARARRGPRRVGVAGDRGARGGGSNRW